MSPTLEQSAAAVSARSHNVPKFGGIGDLQSAHQVSPPASSDNATEEECASEEDEDDTEDDNPVTSVPIPHQQPITSQQVRIILEMVSVHPHIPCVASQVGYQHTQLHYAV